MKHYLMKQIFNIKKSIALFMVMVIFVQASSIVAFAQTSGLSESIQYSMNGSDVIENMEFNDTDGVRVYMKRVIHTNGTAEFTTTKDGKTSVEQLTNHDYNVFYSLANPTVNEAGKNTYNKMLGRSRDITGSQYKHVYISSDNYTITNNSVQQIIVGGASFAAGLLIGSLGLPGATALAVGSFIYTVAAALSPYKIVVSQKLYEVYFTYDNVYYTHCYHELIKSYDTGNHLIDTRTEYHQSVGG